MDTIQFLSIEGRDYRQYNGEFKLDLKVSDDKNVNVIEGQNGAGKSNLLNAITLCFYDDETHIDDSVLEADPLVNLKRLDDLDPGDTATGYVSVKLGDEKPDYIFTREFTTAKQPDGSYSGSTGDLQLKQRIGEDMHDMDNANAQLNQILPTGVHEYFLFDGEQLDEFFEDGYSERVKEGILDVSHIELLNESLDHLEQVQSRLEKQSSEFEGNVGEAEAVYRAEKETLQDLKSDRDTAKTELEEARERRDELDKDLRQSSQEDVREKQLERERLRERLDDTQEDLNDAKQKAGSALATAGITVYNADALRFGLTKLEELEQQGELPPKIQDWFIDRLLERGKCICGEDLDNETRKENLQHLQKEVADIEDENIDGKIRIPDLLDEVDSQVQDLLDERTQVEELREKRGEIQGEIDDISAFLQQKDTIDAEDAAALEQQREEVNKRIEELSHKIGKLEREIEDQQDTVKEKKAEWETEMEKEDQHQILLRRVQFVEEAREEVKTIRTNILDQVRSETEDRLEEYFNELIWKDESYEIHLTENYEVEVQGPTAEKKLASLSAGERQILALAFMSALSRISGFSAPIVIDTPLGRISSKPRKRIAAQLPGYLEGRQVTLMMTDEEYTDDVAALLDGHIANEYELQYNDETTQVIPQ
ncbi:chromosome segregation protein [Natrarchaeobius halalkaliphilus]|uniref:Chromosome segregation protein n=1 Tax=Natrarchaeobius halalkaliphilus TaxID=1679091 RepID=A0A3N6LSC9_9EURY|nr:AAA family ATPase [Natrarchaeobius halalkaliphilus]RQG92818.1 chromosome segregation protein [Natrarchaeobius halalkaliphilus]